MRASMSALTRLVRPAPPGTDADLRALRFVWLLRFRPDRTLPALVDDRSIRFFAAEDGRELGEFSGQVNVAALAFSSDGKRLASAGVDGIATVWDISHINL